MGDQFALMEAVVALTVLLRQYDFSLVPNQTVGGRDKTIVTRVASGGGPPSVGMLRGTGSRALGMGPLQRHPLSNTHGYPLTTIHRHPDFRLA